MLCFFSSFPKVPWIELPIDAKADFLGTSEVKPEDSPFGLSLVTGEALSRHPWPIWHDDRKSRHPNSVFGWFEIPPGFSRQAISRKFENYLDQIEEAQPNFFSVDSGGRGGPLDQLRQLGAYRLLCGRSAKKAAMFVRAANAELYDFKQQDTKLNSWLRAKRAAACQIEKFNKAATELLDRLQSIK